tara:strand:+ start:3526 stop:3885 length:360 start_codon:yes stop_codon:yes gene_type:complete
MTSDTQKALVIAAMLGALFFLARQPKPDAPVGNDYPDAMVVVPPVGMGASTQLDAWADQNNVELRRYTEGVDLGDAEPWIRELYRATDGNRPAAAVRRNGKIIVVPVDDDLLETLKGLK